MSVLNQTHTDFVLYVVDNDSDDRTIQIVNKIKDKRIRIIKNRKNIGMFGNMNKCLELAKAPYIKILCSDDIITPTYLEEHVKIFEKYPTVDLIYSASKIIDDHDKEIFTRKYFSKDKKIDGQTLIKQILISGRNPVGEPSNVTLRGKTIKDHNLNFDIRYRYVSDLDLWIKLLRSGGDAYYVNKILSSFRIHPNSKTFKLYKLAVEEHLTLISKYKNEFYLSHLDFILVKIKLYYFLLIKLILIKLI